MNNYLVDGLLVAVLSAAALLGSQFYLNASFDRNNPVPRLMNETLELGPSARVTNLRLTRHRTSLFLPSYRRQTLRLEGTVINGGAPTIGGFDVVCRLHGAQAPEEALFQMRRALAPGGTLAMRLSPRSVPASGGNTASCRIEDLRHHEASSEESGDRES